MARCQLSSGFETTGFLIQWYTIGNPLAIGDWLPGCLAGAGYWRLGLAWADWGWHWMDESELPVMLVNRELPSAKWLRNDWYFIGNPLAISD